MDSYDDLPHLMITHVHIKGREPTFNGNGWDGVKWYQLEPWPERCVIIYYDIGSNVKIGDLTDFSFENGHAVYKVISDPDGLGCDFVCELQPGSTWKKPPAAAYKN